jgi:hypothetical protein
MAESGRPVTTQVQPNAAPPRQPQPAPDPTEVRHAVMAAYGTDRVTLFHTPPIDRLQTEAAIAAATAVRLAQLQPKISGAFLDVRA